MAQVAFPRIATVPLLRELRYMRQESLPLGFIAGLISRFACPLQLLELEAEALTLEYIEFGLRATFKQVPTLTGLIIHFDVIDVDSKFTKAIGDFLDPMDKFLYSPTIL
ncbi:hypothetical protein CVT25_009407 [Psilocybe cyanescens]|uniref:Uncharacterized protein n=1 Tax=Psilocybe cyanescens TaxID=93625 RepID=A0A409WW14_PSICY|nr:hypothetical protein CVT25_009407 [Psilocybe cyanescens]